ncbi:DUF262 domain-containing protein [Paenibacillus chitinolyticus]|uniref:GmrSD restriction endonuclease domain-containing protein n=1 Tax=Paenibacillus chitinolyticus TaxID=79263 RepID=UPI003556F914
MQRPSGQWKVEDNSLLIHSSLTLFVPDVYAVQTPKIINEKQVNVYDVIDGQQRLTIFYSYRKDEFALTKLEPVTLESNGETYDISGLRFSELPEEVQDSINSFMITFRVLEFDENDDEESIIDTVFYRLNNGKPVSKEHLAFVSASKKVQNYGHERINKSGLFLNVAHFPEGSIKKSDRQMCILQSIIIAGKLDFPSFSTKDVEAIFKQNEIEDETLQLLDSAYNNIEKTFQDKSKFVTKVNIPSMVALFLNNSDQEKVSAFLQWYSQNNKKGDSYRRYCVGGTTKKDQVWGRVNGLQALYNDFVSESSE